MPNRHQLMSIAVLSHFQKIREETRIEHLSRMPEYLSIRVFVDIGNYRHIFTNEALNMKLTAHQKRLDSTFCYVYRFSWCYDYRSRNIDVTKKIYFYFFLRLFRIGLFNNILNQKYFILYHYTCFQDNVNS